MIQANLKRSFPKRLASCLSIQWMLFYCYSPSSANITGLYSECHRCLLISEFFVCVCVCRFQLVQWHSNWRIYYVSPPCKILSPTPSFSSTDTSKWKKFHNTMGRTWTWYSHQCLAASIPTNQIFASWRNRVSGRSSRLPSSMRTTCIVHVFPVHNNNVCKAEICWVLESWCLF